MIDPNFTVSQQIVLEAELNRLRSANIELVAAVGRLLASLDSAGHGGNVNEWNLALMNVRGAYERAKIAAGAV